VLTTTQAFQLIDTSTLRHKRFNGPNVPPYAILPHTWEFEQEVSYQEMMAAAADPLHPARQTSGYSKIQKTYEIALANRIEYAWVDTCCIDKTSSAELSEAINSMFRWYQNAAICYAYLSDLHSSGKDDLDQHLSKCRWFTSGWCFQELIAPRQIHFYDSRWVSIGRKTDQLIPSLTSEITKAGRDVLLDPAMLGDVLVAQKMSWAAERETTRPEDMAYCLLGLFDLNMPMLHGEGKKAFRRLQEEIIKVSQDLSIFAWDVDRRAAQESTEPLEMVNFFAESPRDFLGCHTLIQP